MSYLAVQIEDYLQTNPQMSIIQIEAAAAMKRGTIDSIRRDQHPRPERFGQLLRAVDDNTARRWLIAYLRDDCPPEFLPRLEIVVRDQEGTLKEAAATYAPEGPAAVLASWQRLQAAIEADTSLGRWFIKTVSLILGPVTPPTALESQKTGKMPPLPISMQPLTFLDCTGTTNGVGKITAPQRIG